MSPVKIKGQTLMQMWNPRPHVGWCGFWSQS